MKRLAQRIALVSAVLLLGACAHRNQAVTQDTSPVYSPSRHGGGTVDPAQGQYTQLGTVTGIDSVHGAQTTSGAGVAIGGVAGAVIGRQFGDKGNGRALGTMLGAFAGAVLGNEIERQNRGGSRGYTRVKVQLDRGGERAFNIAQAAELRVGDRVRIENNQMYRL